MDAFDIEGKWWLIQMEEEDTIIPDAAEAGTLTYSRKTGISLELIGSFDGPFEEDTDDDETDVSTFNIFGVTTEGKYVSILNSLPSNRNKSISDVSFTTQSYEKGTIIKGGLVTPESKYWQCSFSFSNIDKWTGIKTVTTPGDHDISIGPAVTKSLSTDDADIILNLHEDMSHSFEGRLGRVYFTIHPDEPLTYSQYLSKYVRPLQNLVTLGLGEAVFPTFLNLYSEQYGHVESKHSAYWKVPHYREQNNMHESNINFTVQDIEFAETVLQWLESSNSVERLHNHYFGTRYNREMYTRSQFMSMMFALEAYHRKAFPDQQKTMDKMAYRRFRETALDRIPKVAVWERVKNLFQSIVNEPSIGDRLLDITNQHENMFPESYDIKSNLSTIKKVRHTIAHSLENDISNKEVAQAEILVRIIVLSVLLDVAGVNETKSRKILSKEQDRLERIVEIS